MLSLIRHRLGTSVYSITFATTRGVNFHAVLPKGW